MTKPSPRDRLIVALDLSDTTAAQAMVARLGDAGLRTAMAGMQRGSVELGLEGYMRAMARRTALVRDWFAFLERYPLVLGPVCAEPPFPWGLDTTLWRPGRGRILQRHLRARLRRPRKCLYRRFR
jgi:hypothetical protein